MAQTILSLISVGLVIYALVDCWRSRPEEVQRLTRGWWALVILLIPPFGALAYLTLGRAPSAADGVVTGPRLVAPDDDPEFLRALEFKRRQTLVEERRRREADEKRRKAERKEQRAERKADKPERTPDATPGAAGTAPTAPAGTPGEPGEPEPDERPEPPLT